ncbi:hypothetical protein [Aeromonas hydrophila]|nr:hypothetical protein [Aeromonas hydrophila]
MFKLSVARSTLYDWMSESSPRYDPSSPSACALV